MVLIEPKQSRSERTLNRILVASEALLARGDFESVSMQAIAERAGVSVGTLYNRFPSKEALLEYLLERFQIRQQQHLEARLASTVLPGLRDRLAHLADLVSEGLATNGGLLRAIALRALGGRSPEDERSRAYSTVIIDQLGAWLLGDGSEVGHTDGQAACRFAAASIAFSLQYTFLLQTPTALFEASDYRDRLVASAWCYLTCTVPEGS